MSGVRKTESVEEIIKDESAQSNQGIPLEIFIQSISVFFQTHCICVSFEAKESGSMSSRYAQVVIPLAVIRHERKAKQYEACTLYGVLTKGTQYTFMQMNTEGQVRTYNLDGSDPAQLKRTTEAESSSQTMDFDNDNEQSSPVV
ncbi:hypothetical protein BDV29DRAFT_161422 [Aspergillus leporis]|uniref:Uncharacterized protein n=1 Tax=Aspergillus leporis TaxID=41062 RepID=A0A5N5WQH5_9EURO|nr:hypothetical protein BDV29DRAFT_161422 [Aspergillus leporis]